MKALTILTMLLALSGAISQPRQKGWRGLIPLHSTQKDVERLLGSSDKKGYGSYIMEDMSVTIIYGSGICKEGWEVTKGTVLRITVFLKKRLTLSELSLDLSLYSKERDGHLPDISLYVNNREGITYKVMGDEVTQINYVPSEQDKNLKCRARSTRKHRKQ
ncbi:MAG: hypothetical protein JNM09_21885 [Blastocatellia bacterium]|nr:hypothetical protein [Blastocatellia bacterium]